MTPRPLKGVVGAFSERLPSSSSGLAARDIGAGPISVNPRLGTPRIEDEIFSLQRLAGPALRFVTLLAAAFYAPLGNFAKPNAKDQVMAPMICSTWLA
jgi:hypothetical protein